MPPRQAYLRTPRGTLPYLFLKSDRGNAPLVVFLHGARDRGDDLSKLLAWGFPAYAASAPDLPYHWLALQIPEGATWPQWQPELFGLIDALAPEHGAVRFTLAGFSLGSAGAWQIAAEHPDRVSALVIVSGRPPENLITPAVSGRLSALPAWIFHGGHDDKVPASLAVSAFEALRAAGGAARLDILPEGDHFIADQVYGDESLHRWLASPDSDKSRLLRAIAAAAAAPAV